MSSILILSCIGSLEIYSRISYWRAKKNNSRLEKEHSLQAAQWGQFQKKAKKLKQLKQEKKLLESMPLKELLDTISSSIPDQTILHRAIFDRSKESTILKGCAYDAGQLATFMLTASQKKLMPVLKNSSPNGQGVSFTLFV